ncbi:Gfo/Idh/MocA family oxidoreductase [bacterium]|nr:MAG: Gfo/Idh/MocA family oxidoreductase [bacterium]
MSENLTRRRFLGVAAATFATPYIITSKALGAPGVPSASNRIAVATIGHGNQMPGLFYTVRGRDDTPIVAVCDVQKNRREEWKAKAEEKNKGVTAYNDFRELLARPDIDAIVMAVPDHWHAPMAVAAAKAGKDIYCEKPLSLTVYEARAMVNAVRRYDRILQTGSMQRSSEQFRRACELVLNGRIGQVKTIHIGLPNNGKQSSEQVLAEEPIPADFDYEMWLGPAPWKPFNNVRVSGDYGGGWRYLRDHSGGMLTDWGAHHFDIAQWALGMDNSGPTQILPPNGKDIKTLTYRYANGVEMYNGMAEGMPDSNGVLFTGTEGKIFVNRGMIRSWPDSILNIPIASDEINLIRSNNQIGNWVDCIRNRELPICDVEIGARSATVCHLGNIAQWVGRPLNWNPKTEQIVGDPEAARWLDRPRRAPWTV